MFALIKDNVIVDGEYTDAKLFADNPRTSFPSPLTDEIRQRSDVYRVVVTERPADTDEFTYVRGGISLVDGVPTQGWEPVARDLAAEASEKRSKQRCTARQARLALAASGSLAAIEAAIAASGEAAQIEWEYANEIERSSPLIESLTAGLGWTEEDLDALFELAVTL